MLVREKNGIVNIEYRLIDQRVTAANDAYPVETLGHLLIAILHIENQVQLHDIHERVEEFLHRHEHQVVSISNQLIQVALMHLTILFVEARTVRFAKRHHYHEVQKQTTNENLKHCKDYKEVRQSHHYVSFIKDFNS